MVFVEAEYVVERDNQAEASRASLLQLAVSSVLSKKAKRAFDKQIKKMQGQ